MHIFFYHKNGQLVACNLSRLVMRNHKFLFNTGFYM